MLDLMVMNGEMSLEFDPLNSKYTIFLNEGEEAIDFQYELKENVNIEIENNYNLKDGSLVILTVFDEKDRISYYFNVYKKNDQEVNKTMSEVVDLNVSTKKEVPEYVGPGIASICFIIILFLFVFLFHKRKSK